MAGQVKGRRLVDAVDEVVAELRLANRLAVLTLGTSALDEVDVSVLKTPSTRRRQERLNKVRAEIRAGLGFEGES